VVFREFVKLDQEHGEQRPGFTAPLAPDLARACTGTGMLESQTDPKRQMWKGGVGHCKGRLLISSLRHLQVSGDFLRPTVLCSELLGNRQIGNAQRQPIPLHLCKICLKNSLGSDSVATNGSKVQDDKAVLKRLEQTSQTPSGSTSALQ